MNKKKSEMMTMLYGKQYSDKLYSQVEKLDPELNEIIQRIPYDKIWSREGLSIRDKSLITISSLISINKAMQAKVHMKGFIENGGKVDEIKNLLIHLSMYCGFPAVVDGYRALNDLINNSDESGGATNGRIL